MNLFTKKKYQQLSSTAHFETWQVVVFISYLIYFFIIDGFCQKMITYSMKYLTLVVNNVTLLSQDIWIMMSMLEGIKFDSNKDILVNLHDCPLTKILKYEMRVNLIKMLVLWNVCICWLKIWLIMLNPRA